MRSQPTLRRPARAALVALAALASIVAATLGLRTSASAQTPAARVLSIKELDKGSTFKHVRNTKTKLSRSALLGDLIVFTNPLADPTGKVVGKLHVECVVTVGASNFMKSQLTCTGVMVLSDGTLTVQTITSPGSSTTTGAVTGGTGTYANARGVFVSPTGKPDTITLVG